MNQYLVLYKNKEGSCFQSIKIWPEIEKMLRKMEEAGGRMRVFQLNGINTPYALRVIHCNNTFWLETMNGIHVEG